MKITIRQINLSILDFTVESGDTTIIEDVTDLNGKLDEGLIEHLEDVVEALKYYKEEWEFNKSKQP